MEFLFFLFPLFLMLVLMDPKGLINSIGVLGSIDTLGSDGEHHLLEQGAAA